MYLESLAEAIREVVIATRGEAKSPAIKPQNKREKKLASVPQATQVKNLPKLTVSSR